MERTALQRFVLGGLVLLACACAAVPKRDTFEARKRLARELIARQDWPEAFFYADQLHRERPADAEVLVLRGTTYREQGLVDEADADLKQALKLQPSLAEAHAAYGLLCDVSGRGGEAESHHRKANDLSPDNPSYLNNLGFSLFLRGKHAPAVQAFQRAVRLSPSTRRIRTNLGFAYAAQGDWPRAAREFERGGATAAQARNNLGFAYERKGDLGTAYGLYLEAVHLDPQFGQARANLMAAAEKLGRELPDDLPAGAGIESKEGMKP